MIIGIMMISLLFNPSFKVAPCLMRFCDPDESVPNLIERLCWSLMATRAKAVSP